MQIALVKRQSKRKCRILRRPHLDLDYFFGRLDRRESELRDDREPEITGPDGAVLTSRQH